MALRSERPNDSLLEELNSVSEAAQALHEYFTGRNRLNTPLPKDFPVEPLIEICETLAALPKGTAEGCRIPLEHARARFSDIRLEYFKNEGRSDARPVGDEADRHLLRGMALDALMNELYIAATTALKEYHRQAEEPFDDILQKEATLEVDSISIREATERSHELEADIAEIAREIDENRYPSSENADRLLRLLVDEVNLSRLVRAEYRFRRIIIRLHKILADGVRMLPQLIKSAGKKIVVGADVADELADWWHATEHKLAAAAIDQFRKFGQLMESIAARFDETREKEDQGSGVRDGDQATGARKKYGSSGLPIPEMIEIPSGSFWMGSPDDQTTLFIDEGPRHEVVIRQPFFMGRYPVTFEEYDAFCTATHKPLPEDNGWGRVHQPVINVSWEDANAYCIWLSEQTDVEYKLPSEAKWEYACRANTETAYWWGDKWELGRANADGAFDRTTEIGEHDANPWGLHDMLGNVWEWTEDTWHETYSDAPQDGRAWISDGHDTNRVLRGGSWFVKPRDARSANRSKSNFRVRDSGFGFRIMRMKS